MRICRYTGSLPLVFDEARFAMKLDKPTRRMTLRELLLQAERTMKDLAEHLRGDFQLHVEDLRELSRPVRRRSQYPTMAAMKNATGRLEGACEEQAVRAQSLMQQVVVLRNRVRREEQRMALVPSRSEAA